MKRSHCYVIQSETSHHSQTRTATQSQTQTTTPEVQQLVADLIMKGPDMSHARKPMTATSAGKPTVAMGMTKVAATMSTKTQPWQKTAMVTAPDPLQVISIDDDEPTLTSNVTAMTMSILDTAMMEEDKSPRTKQIRIMQESIDKLFKGADQNKTCKRILPCSPQNGMLP